jgi:hypothetical protein
LPERILNSDALLKSLIQGATEEPFRQMHVAPVRRWLNVDLPRVQNRHADLVGRTSTGRLLHIEFQSSNDPLMPLRMAEYALAIHRKYREFPVQLVLYVGNEKLRMKPELRTPGMYFHYSQVDIRDLDSESLLASQGFADNLLGLLANPGNFVRGLKEILRRIHKMPRANHRDAVEHLLVTCKLRGWDTTLEEELENMPVGIDVDLSTYSFIRKRIEQGRRDLLLKLLQRRFGELPAPVTERVAAMSDKETEKLALKILDARSLQDLFGPRPKRHPAKPR